MEALDLQKDKPENVFDILDSHRQQENEDDQAIGIVDDPEYEGFAYTGNLGQENTANSETARYRTIKIPDEIERNFLTRRLVGDNLISLERLLDIARMWSNHKIILLTR